MTRLVSRRRRRACEIVETLRKRYGARCFDAGTRRRRRRGRLPVGRGLVVRRRGVNERVVARLADHAGVLVLQHLVVVLVVRR